MKIFAVRDEDNTTNKAVAYLFCYEKEKRAACCNRIYVLLSKLHVEFLFIVYHIFK